MREWRQEGTVKAAPPLNDMNMTTTTLPFENIELKNVPAFMYVTLQNDEENQSRHEGARISANDIIVCSHD
jgi:hypothetical protein